MIVALKDDSLKAQAYINQVSGEVHPGPLSVVATGQVPINLAFNNTLETDLQRAEYVALPITLLLLLLIFAAVVAALLPLGVGVLAIVGGVGGTLFLAHFTDVSQYAINVVTLIGLGVAIDYSLFIVNRFRDELAAGASREDAIATAMSTAGRAITFSGITVAIGLSAMIFFQGTFLASMGAAGAIVVGIAVFYGLTFLPAALSVLGSRVDWWPEWLKEVAGSWVGGSPTGTGVWHSMAIWVMRRPVVVLVPALVILFLRGNSVPAAAAGPGRSGPAAALQPGARVPDTLVKDFTGRTRRRSKRSCTTPLRIPLTAEHVGDMYDLTQRLCFDAQRASGGKHRRRRPMTSSLTKADYRRLFIPGQHESLPATLQQALTIGAGSHIALLNIVTNKPPTSDEARTIVRAVRAEQVAGGQVLATGETAFDLDQSSTSSWTGRRSPSAR